MSHEWHTPTDLVADLKDAIGGPFDLDPASGCEPEPIARERFTKEDDGLSRPWDAETVFVNPPYGRSENREWTEKIHEEAARSDGPELIVALLPAGLSADYWHNHVHETDLWCAIDHRLKFGGADKDPRFDSAIAVFGEDIPRSLRSVLGEWGAVYEPREPLTALDEAGVGSVLSVRLDDRSVGFPENVDTSPDVVVEAGKMEDGVIEIFAVRPAGRGYDHEMFYLLHYPIEDPHTVRCSVSGDTVGWEAAPVRDVELVEPGSSIDPVGYVA